MRGDKVTIVCLCEFVQQAFDEEVKALSGRPGVKRLVLNAALILFSRATETEKLAAINEVQFSRKAKKKTPKGRAAHGIRAEAR